MTNSTIQKTLGDFKKILTIYREKNKQQKKWIKDTDYLKMLDKQNPEKMVENLYSNFSKKNDKLLTQFTELSNTLSDNLKKSSNKDYQKLSTIFGLFASLGNINEKQQQQQYQLKIMKKIFKNEKQRTLLDKFITQIGKIHEKNKEIQAKKISREEFLKKVFSQQDEEIKKEYMELLKKDSQAYRQRCNDIINTYKWQRYYQYRHAFLGLFVFGMVLLLFWYFQSSTKVVFKDINSMFTYFQNMSKDILENKVIISEKFDITSSPGKSTAININPSNVFDNLIKSPVEQIDNSDTNSFITFINNELSNSISNLLSSASGTVSTTKKTLTEIDIEKMIQSAKKTTTQDIGAAFFQGGKALGRTTFQTGKKGGTVLYQGSKYLTGKAYQGSKALGDKAYEGSKALGDKAYEFSGKIMDTTNIVKEQLQLVLLEQMNNSMNVIIQILEYFQTINKLGSQVWNFLIFMIGLCVASFLYCCITIEKLVIFNIIRIQRSGNQKLMDYDLLRQCLKAYM